jgi:hypothetical protein
MRCGCKTAAINIILIINQTVVTDGKVNADAHVLTGVVIGAVGKITTLNIVVAHEPLPVAFAAVDPHAAVNTYCACIV